MQQSHALQVVRLTPDGRGAVAVLLVSGDQAGDVVGRHFLSQSEAPLPSRPLNKIYHGRWGRNDGEDLVVCRRSASEVEIHCHGGRAAAERIIGDLAADGCEEIPWRQWLPETESKGIRAAALIQLAEAPTERTAAVLLDQLHGALAREIGEISKSLSVGEIQAALTRLDALSARSSLGLHLTEPWRVVLAGPPNVGKSSLINALVGYQRAIVFDQPGTTRDIVTASAAFDGWPVNLSDTAGLRASDDPLEAAGVELAKRQIAAADCLVLVTDARQSIDRTVQSLVDENAGAIVVGNKADLLDPAAISPPSQVHHLTSAVTGSGVSELTEVIVRRLVQVVMQPGDGVPFTRGQVEQLKIARALVEAGDAIGAATLLDEFRK